MNDHEESQHRAQRDEYVQELAELKELLEEVDRQITPERVAQRFRDLLDGIADDGCPAPSVPIDPVAARRDLNQPDHRVLINTSAEWDALIRAVCMGQLDRRFGVTIEPFRNGVTPEGACGASAVDSSSREATFLFHAAMSAAAKAKTEARRCIEDARRGAEQMEDAALEKAARIEAGAREAAARIEADARQKAESILDEARKAAASIKATARAEAEEIKAAANGNADRFVHDVLSMPWPKIVALDSAAAAIPSSRKHESCPSELIGLWTIGRPRAPQPSVPCPASSRAAWASWRSEVFDFNYHLAASSPLVRSSTDAKLASYFDTYGQTLRSGGKEIHQVYVMLYVAADLLGVLAEQHADFIVTPESRQEILVQAKYGIPGSDAPCAARPSAPAMALRLPVPSECIPCADSLILAAPRQLDAALWQQVSAPLPRRKPRPDNPILAALGSWSTSGKETQPLVSAWRAIRSLSLSHYVAIAADASATGHDSQDWPGERGSDQPLVGRSHCCLKTSAPRRVASPAVTSGVCELDAGQAHLVLPFLDHVPDVPGDLYEPIGQQCDDPDLLDANAEHCGRPVRVRLRCRDVVEEHPDVEDWQVRGVPNERAAARDRR